METRKTMNWLVGLGLSDSGRGAVRFAAWLRARAPAANRLVGLHIGQASEAEDERPGARPPAEQVLGATRAWLDTAHASDAFDAVELVMGETVEDGLRAEATARKIDALIVGRPGAIEGWSLVSLGRTLRRLLRSTPVPTLVVPPDIDVRQVAAKTIIVAATPRDESLAAVRFAKRVADQFGLEPVLYQVAPAPAAHYMIGATDAAMAYAAALANTPPLEESAAEALADWAVKNDFGSMRRVTVPGPLVAPSIMKGAQDLSAAFIVAGSRQLSLTERILQSSVGSELAACADRPVLIVPPEA